MIETERESTVWVRWPLAIQWGDTSDLEDLQVAAIDQPDDRPNVWIDATLIDEQHPLFRDQVEIAVLAGPADGDRPADLEHDGPGDYALWVR